MLIDSFRNSFVTLDGQLHVGGSSPRLVYGLLKRAMFRLDPEQAHEFVNRFLAANVIPPMAPAPKDLDRLQVAAFGSTFRGALGMAAGFDKEAKSYQNLFRLGFHSVEVGTVTPEPQPGNEKPRVWRAPEEQALVNAMGFPGPGQDVIAHRIAARSPLGILGVNLGPNKWLEADQVPGALEGMARTMAPLADFLTINVSSPNTPGLRSLQTPEGARALVEATIEGAQGNAPVLLKLHPDASFEETNAVALAAVEAGVHGIIATNTTASRTPGTERFERGGLSGKPLFERALVRVRSLAKALDGQVPLVGVGGISTGADAAQMIEAGASLLQGYTGFIYRGPGYPNLVSQELIDILDARGLDHIHELQA